MRKLEIISIASDKNGIEGKSNKIKSILLDPGHSVIINFPPHIHDDREMLYEWPLHFVAVHMLQKSLHRAKIPSHWKSGTDVRPKMRRKKRDEKTKKEKTGNNKEEK